MRHARWSLFQLNVQCVRGALVICCRQEHAVRAMQGNDASGCPGCFPAA